MQKSVRLLKIWKLCKEQRYQTAQILAQKCGVTERTIYRDLQMLGELGVAIACNGGYRVVSEAALPQFDLTEPEQLFLTLALRSLPIADDPNWAKIANGLFNKLLEQPAGNQTVLLEPQSRDRLAGTAFSRLQKAIEARHLIRLKRYRKLTDEIVTDLLIEPYILIHRAYHWYLVAWTGSLEQFRTYRVDRIERMQVEKETYTVRPFDPKAYFRGSFEVMVGKPQRLRVRFTGLAKQIVLKGGRFQPQDLHEDGDAVLLDTTMSGEIQWLRWILGFGGEAEILEPKGLQQQAQQMLAAGLAVYKKEKKD